MVTRDFLFFDNIRHKTILADSLSRKCPSQKCIHIRGPTSKNLKTSQFQILGERVLSKIEVLKKFRKNFSYVFPERTLYSLPLEAESNGRAVRA